MGRSPRSFAAKLIHLVLGQGTWMLCLMNGEVLRIVVGLFHSKQLQILADNSSLMPSKHFLTHEVEDLIGFVVSPF